MGLDIYFKEDVRNALLAADQASSSTARQCGMVDNPSLSSFLTGYRAALGTIAIAFGLSPGSIRAEPWESLIEAPPEDGLEIEGVEVVENAIHDLPDRVWK